jgi:quinoprotein glucose dehydrogenase
MKYRLLSSLYFLASLGITAFAGDERQVEVAKQGGFVPKIQPASEEAANAIKQFKIDEGLKVDLWAAEPLLANPVSFATDEKGRWFVAETFRLHAGVSDIRAHMHWLEEELASTTLESFLAILKADPKVDLEKNALNSERVQMLWDSKGTGTADSSKIFAEGFNDPLSGIAAGVLARKGNVYLTSIPDLWLLQDNKRSGTADSRTSLAKGFGIRTAFLGHDLHGLRIGPDGRLYFSVGDRGANATAIDGSRAVNTETGAVYRCNLDGTSLEIFALGLRNPQELAFDQYGNLFTGDNNSDAGDPARWVYVQQNSDSGWRIGWQFIQRPEARGPWLSERLCYPSFPGQAAYHLPPVAVLGNGPSGLTYHPGTGLTPAWKDHFFLANFSGSPSNSGILSVSVSPKGAGFEMSAVQKPIWNILATDVEFGVDGSLYVADWVNGWGMNGKGRIYRLHSAESDSDPFLQETKKILNDGMEGRSPDQLALLLAHADMRIRQEAQFALAARSASFVLQKVASKDSSLLARLHAVWGLGQIARTQKKDGAPLLPLLKDPEAEVRAQAAKTLGDIQGAKATPSLLPLLKDTSPRVRSFAAIALGNLKSREASPALLEALRENNNADPVLRQALCSALAGCNDATLLTSAASDPSSAVRLGAVVALRRLKHANLTKFLQDSDPFVIAEAARAIHDESIHDAMPELAALLPKASSLLSLPDGTKELPTPRDAILRRVINAAFRTGNPSNATALAQFAVLNDAPEAFRLQAIQALANWSTPPRLDRVMGLFRPLPQRDMGPATTSLKPHLSTLLAEAPFKASPALRVEALQLLQKHGDQLANPLINLPAIVANASEDANVRIQALQALAALKEPKLPEIVALAATDKTESLRKAATKLRIELHLPGGGLESLSKLLEIGTPGEKQNVLSELATLSEPGTAAIFEQQLDLLSAGKLQGELHLELLEAASKRSEAPIKTRLARFQTTLATQTTSDPLAPHRLALLGGNAAEGRRIFMEKVEASCIRCHKVQNDGAEVGPNLTGVGKRQSREYLLESIVEPNAKIAQGFESVVVTLTDGSIHAGILKSDSAEELSLMPPTGTLEKLEKSRIKTRESGPSGMPPLAAVLSKREIRDLVEYLASLK